MKIVWRGPGQWSPEHGELSVGRILEVGDKLGAAWIAKGVAEEVEAGAKRRRVAAPEPAPEA
jgi:hypothetical protein